MDFINKSRISLIKYSCTPTRLSRFAPKSSIRSNCSGRRLNKCGASRWRQNLLKMLTVKMNYVVTLVVSRTKASPYKMVRKIFLITLNSCFGTELYFEFSFHFISSGIIKGDEIIVINGAIVSDLDMMYLESVLQEEQALCMMMR